jgi:hypothetical protein
MLLVVAVRMSQNSPPAMTRYGDCSVANQRKGRRSPDSQVTSSTGMG